MPVSAPSFPTSAPPVGGAQPPVAPQAPVASPGQQVPLAPQGPATPAQPAVPSPGSSAQAATPAAPAAAPAAGLPQTPDEIRLQSLIIAWQELCKAQQWPALLDVQRDLINQYGFTITDFDYDACRVTASPEPV